MLPETSSAKTTDIGREKFSWRCCSKKAIGRSTPSSKILKSCDLRPLTGLPWASVTVASNEIRSVRMRMTSSSVFWAETEKQKSKAKMVIKADRKMLVNPKIINSYYQLLTMPY